MSRSLIKNIQCGTQKKRSEFHSALCILNKQTKHQRHKQGNHGWNQAAGRADVSIRFLVLTVTHGKQTHKRAGCCGGAVIACGDNVLDLRRARQTDHCNTKGAKCNCRRQKSTRKVSLTVNSKSQKNSNQQTIILQYSLQI